MTSIVAMASFALISVLVSSLLLAVQAQSVCDLQCHANTTCIKGHANFSHHNQPQGKPLEIHEKTVSPNGYHCKCPPGLTGLQCGRKYYSCNDGRHKCYNGGKCLEGLQDEYGNHQLFCDCSAAVDSNGVEYVGKYCEIPKPMPCGDSTIVEAFCVNGGYCKSDFRSSPHRPCRCGPYHDGPHCEFDKGEIPDCTMKCENGGHCELGIKTYGAEVLQAFQPNWDNGTDDGYQHCACPEGYYGLKCEIESSKCGEHHCYHGSSCVTTVTSGGETKRHCDCTMAHSEGSSYAGKYCQYESTILCSDDPTKRGHAFCVNGGTCHPDGDHFDCVCPDGYSGPLCEYHDESEGEPQLYADCELNCQNDGQCRKGAKDTSHLDGFDVGPIMKMLNISYNENFEHCVCPDGYAGLECEIKMASCGQGEHICLHGSKCLREGDDHSCDCANAFTPFERYEGRYCEFHSSDICTVDGKPGKGRNNFAFCVNGGKCKGVSATHELHKGCTCPPGFIGDHCEITEKPDLTQKDSKGLEGVAIVFISLATVGFVLVSVATVLLWKRRKDVAIPRPRSMEPSAADGPIDGHAIRMDFGVERDPWENTELHAVDIT